MSDQSKLVAGAAVGALVGAAASYLFFTDGGRVIRDRIEPAVDDLIREFHKFRGTLQKVGDMAADGMRALNEFNTARMQSPFGGSDTGTSH